MDKSSPDKKTQVDCSQCLNRRKDKRSVFIYPVYLRIVHPELENKCFSGYIDYLSEIGAGIYFDDRYGLVHSVNLVDYKVKLTVHMLSGDNINILSCVKWMKHDTPQQFFVKMGVEFEDMEPWQVDAVKELLALKDEGHVSMWNLIEDFDKSPVGEGS